MGVPFISQQDLSDRLGRDVTSDPGALSAVDAACEICREIAEQDFDQVIGDTITLDGSGTDTLILPERPVFGAGTIVVNGQLETIGASFTPNGLLYRGSAGGWGGYTAGFGWAGAIRPTWPQGRQNVQVTYDHGYGTANMPRAVREVALQIAMRLVVQGAAIAETVGAVNVRYAVSAGALDSNELRILQKYRGPASV